MTCLSLPRIAFHSANALSNVSTANNQNVVDILDFDNVTLKNPYDLPPDEYRAWLMELCDVEQNGAYRRTMFGYWNYYGDQLTTFGDATVTSVQLPPAPVKAGAGAEAEAAAADPLATANIALIARLVDLDPADTFTSQMFTSSFVVSGVDSDGQPFTLIDGGQPSVAATRFLNFGRPYGAGSFWCVIPAERLSFAPRGVSDALDVLRTEVERGGGLAIRYVLYDMQAPIITDEQVAAMREAFLRGEYVLNPKIGYVAGTFGAWHAPEPVSAPGGAWLYPAGTPYTTSPKDDLAAAAAPVAPPLSHGAVDAHWDGKGGETLAAPASAAASDGPLEAAPAPAASAPSFGPAFAVSDGKVVTLDLGTTFPEVSKDDPTKVDVGVVMLYAGSTWIGQVDYSRETYERFGGVVEVPIPPTASDALKDQPLSLQCAKYGLVAEEVTQPYVVVDRQCTYLDLPDATGEVEVRVFQKNGSTPLERPVTLVVEQWQDYNTPSTTTPGDPPKVSPPGFNFRRIEVGDPARMVPDSLVVPTNGVATLPIKGTVAGCYKIRLYPAGVTPGDPNQGAGFTIDYFCAVRVLPHDDYSNVPDQAITWDYVWREVFCYYALMYPVMSQYVPWGPPDAPLDPDRVHTLALVLRELVDERNIGTSMYMPITRELSAGKRALIRRWCDLQLGIKPA